MKKSGERDSGGRGKIESRNATQLSDLGITRDQSSQWQAVARVPRDDFEEALSEPGIPSTAEKAIETECTTPRLYPSTHA
jgi:hypothetical protein